MDGAGETCPVDWPSAAVKKSAFATVERLGGGGGHVANWAAAGAEEVGHVAAGKGVEVSAIALGNQVGAASRGMLAQWD